MSTPDILSPSVSSENFTREEVQAAGEVKLEPVAWRCKSSRFGDGWQLWHLKPKGFAHIDPLYSTSTVEALTQEITDLQTVNACYTEDFSALKAENAALLSRVERLEMALKGLVASCASSPTPMSEGETRMVTAPSRSALVEARATLKEISHD